jgi:glycosyltransferase involved in cell wall biosynthesis
MHSENKDRPLVSFIVIAYKQERFIREAVEGAFVQTYSPLEIILSDDCSPDRTFEIMQEMAASYRGKHSVKLNQMTKNKGLAASINFTMALAAGELVVVAAGDDCSLPHRVETLTSEWMRAGRPSGIGSAVKNIDEHGKLIELLRPVSNFNQLLKNTSKEQMLRQLVQYREFVLTGCSAAWSKETWNKFGDLMETVVNEDNALSFRSLLDRGLCFIEEPLVLYRRHTNNMWNTANIWNIAVSGTTFTPAYYRFSEETSAKRASLFWMVYQNLLSDLKSAVSKKMIEPATAHAIEADILKAMRRFKIQVKWWDLPFFRRLSLFADSPHRSFPLNVTSLLPLKQHAALRCLLNQIKKRIALKA